MEAKCYLTLSLFKTFVISIRAVLPFNNLVRKLHSKLYVQVNMFFSGRNRHVLRLGKNVPFLSDTRVPMPNWVHTHTFASTLVDGVKLLPLL